MHVIVGLRPHGAETMLERMVLADPASIPGTFVVSLTSPGAIGEALRGRGVSVHALGMTSAWSVPQALWQLARLIRRIKPDVVQTWMYHADFLGGIAARLAGCRNVAWGIHRTSLSLSGFAPTMVVMRMCAWLSHRVPRRIVCVAEAARQGHIALGYCPDRMVVIHNGFEIAGFGATGEDRRRIREQCRFGRDSLVVGAVGRFHPDKGQSNFIKAAAIVANRRSDVHFLMVGRACDSGNAALIALLAELGMQDRFVLLGERADVAACLAAMDVFCMPSRTEAFPVGLGEAMIMGLPCVATSVGDTAALAGDTAILVPPEDEQALARGLLSVLALSRDERAAMGGRASERVRAEFPIEKVYARYHAMYDEIVSGDRA